MKNTDRSSSFSPSYAGKIGGWIAANRVLIALLLLAALKSLLWSVAIPPWRAPDEPQHFGYIEYLSREKSIPLHGQTYLYPDVFESLSRTNFAGITGSDHTDVDPQTRRLNPAAGHPPLYYLTVLPIYQASAGAPIETQLYLIRVFGIIFSMALIVVSWRFAQLVFPDAPYLQIGVPLLMIFHPQLGFITAAAMNDGLLTLLFTLFLYQLVIFAKGDFSPLRAAIIGIVVGLGMLTKSSFLIAYPIGLLVGTVLLVLRKGQRVRLLRAAALVLAISFLICFWYYLRNYLELGMWQPSNRGERYQASGWWDLLFHTTFRTDLITSFLGNFSWLTIPLPKEAVFWFNRVAELSILGLAASLVLGWRRRSWELLKPWLALLFMSVFSLFVLAATYYELQYSGAQGRYLFPADFVFWSLILAGLVGWMPPSWRPRATALVVTVSATFFVWSLFYEFIGRVT